MNLFNFFMFVAFAIISMQHVVEGFKNFMSQPSSSQAYLVVIPSNNNNNNNNNCNNCNNNNEQGVCCKMGNQCGMFSQQGYRQMKQQYGSAMCIIDTWECRNKKIRDRWTCRN